MINNEKAPCHHTIVRRLKLKFAKERRDFNKWVIEFFNPNHKTANKVGQFAHNILELIFIQFCIENNLKGYNEISPTLERDTIVDNALVDLNAGVKMISIDYTISNIQQNLFDKLFKGYQSNDRALFIVALTSDRKICIPQNYPKSVRKNVRIMNADEFAKYMGYDGNYLKAYKKAIDLSRIALFDDNAYNILERESKNARLKLAELSKIFPISEKELINYLRSGTEKDYAYILKDLRFRKLDIFTDSSFP